jgi:tetratricopeptide (TPR) repeat protein
MATLEAVYLPLAILKVPSVNYDVQFHSNLTSLTPQIALDSYNDGSIGRDGAFILRQKSFDKEHFEENAREAITCYRMALRLRPNHPHAYTNLGNAMRDRGLIREAIHCNVTAARLMPCFAPAHANLASLLREQGQLDQAIAHYHQAINFDPEFAEAYLNLGSTYRELRQLGAVFASYLITCKGLRLDDAMKCYTTALKISPDLAEAHAALAAVAISV